jgi:hypothetical protein
MKVEDAREHITNSTGLSMQMLADCDMEETSELTWRQLEDAVTTERGLNIEADGCDFIEATNFYLSQRGCPENARRFVCYVMGYSGGASEIIEICDAELARRSGCSTKTIQRWRKSLVRWELQKKAPVLEIFEGDFYRDEKKNKPTRYRVLIAKLAADIVRSARNSPRWESDSRSAIEAAARQVSGTPARNLGLIHRRHTGRGNFKNQIEGRRKAALTHLRKICHLHSVGYHYLDDEEFTREAFLKFWMSFRREAKEVIRELLFPKAPKPDR